MIKVSVLVPVYNVEEYLEQCLKSIINQTLKDIEIICINDGSKDNSLNILKEYSKLDSRIKLIDKENSGYGDSMNQALEIAQGKYIAIVESDDFVEKEIFENLYNLAEENDCDIVKSDWYDYFTATNSSYKNTKVAQKKCNEVLSPLNNPEILSIQPSLWSAIYKRDLIEKNNIRFLPSPGASYQDTSFTFKVFALAKRVYLTDRAYMYYRQDNAASSINSKGKLFAICEEYKEIDNFLNKYPKLKSVLLTQKLSNQYRAYIWTFKRISDKFRKEFVLEFSGEFKQYMESGELTEEFVKGAGKKNIEQLIKNPQKFLRKLQKKLIIEKWKKLRSKIISIKINSKKICIKLLGKQIINID